jgi:hypothetical protein
MFANKFDTRPEITDCCGIRAYADVTVILGPKL